MSLAIIRNFFQNKVATWAAAQSPAVAVAYENVPYTPVVGTSYVQCYLVPAETIVATVKADRFREIGLFKILLYTKSGIGTKLNDELVQSLVAYFPAVPKELVSIESHPFSRKLEQEQAGWECTAVLMPYRLES